MDAEPTQRAPPHPSEDEAARDPAALAGGAPLKARLKPLTPDQRDAFREAVRRCYAPPGDE